MTFSHVSKGFTLLEILLVVLIVSILTAVGVNIINSQSIERHILNQAQQFSDDLKFLCEKAVLENQAFGIEFHSNGYQALRYQQPDWFLLESQILFQVNESLAIDLLLEGLSQNLDEESVPNKTHLPHIICQSDGSFNTFELRISAAVQNNESFEAKTYYAIKPSSPWQLNGAWYQP